MRILPVVVDRLRMVHQGFSVFVCVAVAFSVKLFSHDMCPCNVCAPFAVRPVEISIISAGIYCEFQTWCGWHDPSQLCDTGSWSSYLASPTIMYRIEGSGGVIRNCWQLIIIPKYINRGHPKTSGTILSRHWRCNMRKALLSRLAKSSLWLVQGRVKHGTRGCTDTESQCKNSGASTGLQWTRVQSAQLCKPVFSELLWTLYSTVSTTAASAPAFATLHHSDDWPDSDAGQSLDFRQKYIK